MVKLAKKLALCLVPVVIYFAVFIYFEPYNYFGIKESEYTGDSAIVRVRNYNADPGNVVLLGDSRMAHFDMNVVEGLVGEKVSPLSFGGASLNESMDLLYYAAEHNPDLHTVYFGVSFYTLNKSYYKDRMSSIETISTNPIAYMLNLNYNVDMLNEIKWFLKGEKNVASAHHKEWEYEDLYNEDGTPRKYRKNLMEYVDTVKSVADPYELDTDDVERYIEMAKFCRENDITLYTIITPMDESLKEYVVRPLGIDEIMKAFIDEISPYTTVLDFAYNVEQNPFTQEQYFDGFHLDTYYGLPEFERMLFFEHAVK